MACGVCCEDGHNTRTCPSARRCGGCEQFGHYITTCPEQVCRVCGERGHNAAGCEVEEEAGDEVADIEPPTNIRNLPLPLGRRIVDFGEHAGWIHRWTLLENAWDAVLDAEIAATRRYRSLRPAFKHMAPIIHKASRHTLYVGRTAPTASGLAERFADHIAWRGADWIRPLVVTPLEVARDRAWETVAIRWLRAQEDAGRLCCNNSIAASTGRWPDHADVLIYVVAITDNQ